MSYCFPDTLKKGRRRQIESGAAKNDKKTHSSWVWSF